MKMTKKMYLSLLAVVGGLFILGGCSQGSDKEPVAPTVLSCVPADLGLDAPIGGNIAASFSEAMDVSTIHGANFTLSDGTSAVAGIVTYQDMVAIFNPDANLAVNTRYTAKISTGVLNAAGTALGAEYIWTFTTGSSADTSAPTVSAIAPADHATDIVRSDNISATFSESMDSSTITAANFSVAAGALQTAGVVTFAGNTATFDPSADFAEGTVYTVTISTEVKDLSGNALASEKKWSFTTDGAPVVPDTTAPSIISVYPADLALNRARDCNFEVVFSEDMDSATLVAANVTLFAGAVSVPGVVSYSGKTATFNPSANLEFDTCYTAKVNVLVTDAAGNALASAKEWTFSTVKSGIGPSAVSLGSSGKYAILAKTAISTIPASVITGNIGLSPYAETYMTGFSQTKATGYSTSTQVIGVMHAADMTSPTSLILTTAVSDMETAYTDAAGRVTPDFVDLHTGAIGGKTLAPGLYKWNTSVSILSDLTLSGGENDIWIFQISGDLALSNAYNVFLSGGAQAKNIFWQVAGTATMGTTSHFEGVVLCQTAITMNTGATMNGRLLAQSRVDLDQATVTQPAL
jgi:hypothetical protein